MQQTIEEVSALSHAQLVASGMSELEALTSLHHAYGAYDKRLDDWFSRRGDLSPS